jgi:monoamine oxidase
LIHTLAKQWNNSNIILNQVVESIRREKDIIHINTTEDLFKAKIVVSTLPPKLLAENIAFTPSLPSSLDQTCRSTHTWMGEAIKVGLTYRNPFWRKPGTSGTIMSNVGPIFEMYDHSNYEDTLFALKGFMNNAYHAISKTERKKLIIAQLIKFYGKQAEKFQSYQETVWKHEPYTYSKYSDSIIPHQNNGNPQFGKPNWNGSLFIAGSETAATYPGYMDGAVESAIQTVKKIKETFGS